MKGILSMLLLKSIILGFSVSAPVGPIGLLCIQRVLSHGRKAGILTGMGAVSANIIYAGVAAFGFSMVSGFLFEQQHILNMLGSAFLFYLGFKTFLKKSADSAANLGGESLLGMFLSTFLLMITNPVAILNFAAMFAGLGFSQGGEAEITAMTLVTGVFIGAAFWWILLSIGVNLLKNRITPYLGAVNKVAGLLIILLGILALIR
jgi:threonine/homoserine/homoserine lactone efflux protein